MNRVQLLVASAHARLTLHENNTYQIFCNGQFLIEYSNSNT